MWQTICSRLCCSKFTAALAGTTETPDPFIFTAQRRLPSTVLSLLRGKTDTLWAEKRRTGVVLASPLFYCHSSTFHGSNLRVHVWSKRVHMQEIDQSNRFLFAFACVPLHLSYLALSYDTVWSISVKNDDNDNLRGKVHVCVCVRLAHETSLNVRRE